MNPLSLRLLSVACCLCALPALAGAATLTPLYQFGAGGVYDAAYPNDSPVMDAEGNLWGVTPGGGYWGVGSIYKLDRKGVETRVYDFFYSNLGISDIGIMPKAGLAPDGHGNFYGTTAGGYGAVGSGSVFKVAPDGKVTLFYRFLGSPDGVDPASRVTFDSVGNIYGATHAGGTHGFGTIYKITPSGQEVVLHSFTEADGRAPMSTPVLDARGNLYGPTQQGGDTGNGVFWKLDAAGNLTVLHHYTGGADGYYPFGEIAADADGNFYGTTEGGGQYNQGVLYRISPSGEFTVLHDFSTAEGFSWRGVRADGKGNLLGGASAGEAAGFLFKYSIATGEFKTVYAFQGGSGGCGTTAPPLIGPSGVLYGTSGCGQYNAGMVYRIKR